MFDWNNDKNTEIQEVKEKLKDIFRAVINNEKVNNGWVTMKDKEGEPYYVKLDEETDRKEKTEDKKEDTTDKDNQDRYLKKGDLELGKVYKLGMHYIKPKEDENGNLYFDDNIGVWGGQLYFLKDDLKNIERIEKYDKLTDKELKFLSEKEYKKEQQKEEKKTGKKEPQQLKLLNSLIAEAFTEAIAENI